MADPFLAAIGVKEPAAAPAQAKGKTYDPLDLAVRMTMLEEADPSARQWVAGVMANRAKNAKGDLLSVLTAPKAFEPWAKKRDQIAAIDPNSDEYKATAAAVLPILQGKAPDPSGGAINFYAPESQAAATDGRPSKAEFDDGKGVKVGKTLFFGGDSQAPDPFLAAMGIDATKVTGADLVDPDAKLTSVPLSEIVKMKGAGDLLPNQMALYKAMTEGGAYKPDSPQGSATNPVFLQKGAGTEQLPAGTYYIDNFEGPTGGKMQRVPGGEAQSSIAAGLGQGAADVATTLFHMAPGSDDSTIKNRLIADQAIYGAQYGGDFKSGMGRFAGQVGASALPLVGAEAAAAPALARLGPVGAFLMGQAGAGGGLGPLALRGASLATKGAFEGGAGAGLISSADDAPVGEQIGAGMVGGALLGPVIPGVAATGRWAGRTVRDLTEPLSAGGRDRIAGRIIGNFGEGANMTPDASEIIPGSIPTLAQATGNPGIATLERTARLARPVPFAERDAANAEARAQALDPHVGDEHTVADLVATRQPVVEGARNRVFAATTPTDPHPVVAGIDAALASPEAHMDDVRRPLEALRDKLVSPPPEMTPAEVAALHREAGATFGAEGDAWTPEVMDAARAKLGAKFQEIAGKTEVAWDDTLRNDIGGVLHDVAQVVPESSLPPLFKQLDNIASTANDGKTITGASYQALTKKGSPLDSLMNASDPTIRQAASRIREALDDALERSVAAKAGPAAPTIHTPESLAADAQSLDLNTFLDKHVSEMLPGHMEHDVAPARAVHGKFKLSDVGPSEYDDWAQAQKEIGDSASTSDGPVLINQSQGYAPSVVDGHHRVVGALNSGATEIEGTYDAETLAEMWKAAHGDNTPTRDLLGKYEAEHLPERAAAGAPTLRNPVEDLRATRLAYKNLKTAEAALRSSGTDRTVTPRALYNAVKQNFGSYTYKGGGPLGDVAEAAMRAQETRPPVVESNPQQIHGMRDALSTSIDKLDAQGTDEATRAANRLREVRAHMDAAIEKGAPGYGSYLDLAERSREPIEAQKFLQGLKLTDAKGNVQLGRVKTALDRIHQMRAKPGDNAAKKVSAATIAQLEALRDDLLRADQINRGRPIGSDTAQHIVTNNIAGNLGVPLGVTGVGAALAGHPLVGAAIGAGKVFYGMKNEQVLDALANRLLIPQTPEVIERAPPPQITGPLRRLTAPLLPVAGGILANRLVGAQ